MITDADHHIIKEMARKYSLKRVLLFGSSVESVEQSNDIDIAIEGIAPEHYYQFYGDLLFLLSKPVDMIDLSIKSKFTDLVRKEGVLLYG